MHILLAHPEIASRPCEQCVKYHHNDRREGGKYYFGELAMFRGKPLERRPFEHPPCAYGPTLCPKGSPDSNRELSERNLRAYIHYLQCKRTHRFPIDAIVERNAGIIALVEEMLEVRHRRMMKTLMELMAARPVLG